MDLEAFELDKEEYDKRDNELDFIASQNLCSEDTLEACSSIAQMKYSEGFPGKRYYAGCEVVDKIESRCEEELLKLFNASDEYSANVQPANGSSANFITYRALLEPNDKVLAPDTNTGGHISHAHPLATISQYYQVTRYGLDDKGFLDYDEIEKLAIETKPKLIIVGMSNYSRIIDYKRFRAIADKVGAYLMADIAHISGLIATGLHPSPVGLADVITSTTHKILRGPRSAFIIYKKELDKQIKRAIIPGCFGGADQAKILAKLICFKEAQSEEYKNYCEQVVKNAKAMVNMFKTLDIPVLTGNTENHSFCLDLSDWEISGRDLANKLAEIGIITNCNAIPNDKKGFFKTSGLRMGTPSVTTRGLDECDCAIIAQGIATYLNMVKSGEEKLQETTLNTLKHFVNECVSDHSIKYLYPNMFKRFYGPY